MTTIKVKGTQFGLTGRIKGHTRREVVSAIQAKGGFIITQIRDGLDVAIIGNGASGKKIDRAKALGLTIIGEDELFKLMEHGEVTLVEEAPLEDLSEAIEDLRGLLYDAPTAEVWSEITSILDQCSPSQLGLGLDYVGPKVESWARGSVFDDAAGERRVATADWLTSLLAGDESPKYALVRAVSFSSVAVKTAQAVKIFETDQLPNLRVFDIGESNSTSVLRGKFFAALATAANLEGVDTLVARRGHGVCEPLLRATSLPNLRHLYIRGRDLEPLIEGPWAAQLHSLEVGSGNDLRMLETAGATLHELRTLNVTLGIRYSNIDSTTASMVEAMSRAEVWDRVQTLRLRTHDAPSLAALCQGLGERAPSALKTLSLDLRYGLGLSGDSGRTYLESLFEKTGLADVIEEVVFGPGVDADVCEYAASLGLKVQAPALSAPRSKPAVVSVALASGDAERREAGQLDWTDAMLFETPTSQSWDVLTGVADALVHQGDTDGLAQLEQAIEGWPVQVRDCPIRWMALFDRPERDPRLGLVRKLSPGGWMPFKKSRQNARWLAALAQSPHIDVIELIELWSFAAPKAMLEALEALFAAARPTQCRIEGKKTQDNEAIAAHLKKAGVLGERLEGYPPWSQPVEYRDASGLDGAHTQLVLDHPDALEAVLARDDLDHVVSLSMKIDVRQMVDLPFTATAPTWEKLRHLSLKLHFMDDTLTDSLAGPLATWFSKARPVVIDVEEESLSSRIIDEGVYRRAFGSTLKVGALTPLDRVQEIVSGGQIRVGRLARGYGHFGELNALAPLVEAMSEELRQILLGLSWPLPTDEFSSMETLIGALPNLTTWYIESRELPERRDDLINALAASPATRRLSPFMPVLYYRSSVRTKGLSAKHLKQLAKGEGLLPDHFLAPPMGNHPSL